MTQTVSPIYRLRPTFVILLLATMTLATIPMNSAQAQNLPATLYTIEGFVYDASADPLEGASVLVYPSGGGDPLTDTTDASGAYSISGVAAGTYNATANAEGFDPAFVPIKVAGADMRIQQSFLLRRPDQTIYGTPVTLSGVVLDDNKKGLADVLIEVWSYYYPAYGGDAYMSYPVNNNQMFTVHSESDGSYSVTVSEGSVSLTARKDGFDVLHANFESREDRTLDLPMHKNTQQSVTVFGTVKDEDGKPIPYAWVNVQPDYRCYERGTCPVYESGMSYAEPQEGDVYFYYEPSVAQYNSTNTDENGKYSMQTLPGELMVQASADQFMQEDETITVEAGDEQKVDFVLEQIPPDSVKISGRVVDAETGDPIPYAQVNVENQPWGGWGYAQTDEDGRYEVMTKPGYTLVTASAYQYYWMPCYETASPEPAYESDASEPSGDKVAGNGTAGSSGGIRAPDSYPCDGQQERGRDYMSRIATIIGEEDGAHELDFELVPRPLPTATFQGYVVNESSEKGVAGVTVNFYNELTHDYGTATTDDDGSYKIKVHGGYYTVRTYAEDYYDAAVNVEIDDDETQRLDLFVQPGEKRYGYCCVAYGGDMAYAKGGGAGYATATMAPVAEAHTDSRGASSGMAVSDGDEAAAGAPAQAGGNQAYYGAGGGLGPYAPAENGVIDDGAGGKANGAPLLVILGALFVGALALRRRRA